MAALGLLRKAAGASRAAAPAAPRATPARGLTRSSGLAMPRSAAAARGPALGQQRREQRGEPSTCAQAPPRRPPALRLCSTGRQLGPRSRASGPAPLPCPCAAGVAHRAAAASTDTDILELTEQNVETVLDEVRPCIMLPTPPRSHAAAGACMHAAARARSGRAAMRWSSAHAHHRRAALTPAGNPTHRPQVRPYLMADGGNVEFVEIDGLVVRLRLAGACGSCPSSLTTMTMGIKRRLMERIPVRCALSCALGGKLACFCWAAFDCYASMCLTQAIVRKQLPRRMHLSCQLQTQVGGHCWQS